ncbi:GDSL-type esterase/lipase family protein [Acidipila sp. EB88]|uniref:GDSL-type esterase/lipase family protein n=1 Tax=Acidipila sp. EB88 TaxID=2305226 RepID=UPI000F5DAA98|nr:GDSL-type esterase/lipase family protein [Acidipila sp. EB88]RRA49501.1 capsular biosynthesis protein [Acidipila sp. EB88]
MPALRALLTLALSAGCAGVPCATSQQAPPQPVDPAHMSSDAVVAQQQELDRYRRLANDYGQLSRYAAANAALAPALPGERRVVFFGDSITDGWHLDQYFPGKNYVNRGIGGQTTPQMLVRFRQDVLALRPALVVILAGTNDLAGNTGPETLTQIESDYASLAELARANGVRVVFSSVMPVSNYVFPNMTTGRPPAQILTLNAWLEHYCAANSLVYLDYFKAMVDPAGMLRRELSGDGLHPNPAGFAAMTPLAAAAIDKALAQPPAPVPGTPAQ